LRFRYFEGERDFPHMAAVLVASESADGLERHVTSEDLATAYGRLTDCDPYLDMIIAEVAGEVVGYARASGWDDTSSGRRHGITGFLAPAWRRKGIGSAMLRWAENRVRDIAAAFPTDQAEYFQASTSLIQEGMAKMLERAGYQPVRYFYEMVRPNLEDIPDLPLPDGVALRPVSPDHYRAIWRCGKETGLDEWEHYEEAEDGFQAWLTSARFQPQLWQVAWDTATGQIAGQVETFIAHEENAQMSRKRGYTEGVGVVRAWRRRGLARALIAHSLRAQKAAGMSESALVADSESASGATRLYESCGFQIVGRSTIYRKPL